MSNLTFSTFLRIVEDANSDIQKLMTDIATIDAELAKRSGPLLQRKMMLTKQLQAKQKQAASGPNTQQTGMVSGTTTPGSAGSATPGSAPPGM